MATRELLDHLSRLRHDAAVDAAVAIIAAVRELDGRPRRALRRHGRYQHSYREMAATRDAFVASAKDRMTALHLGRSLDEEARAL